jgi:hypothetical protein
MPSIKSTLPAALSFEGLLGNCLTSLRLCFYGAHPSNLPFHGKVRHGSRANHFGSGSCRSMYRGVMISRVVGHFLKPHGIRRPRIRHLSEVFSKHMQLRTAIQL